MSTEDKMDQQWESAVNQMVLAADSSQADYETVRSELIIRLGFEYFHRVQAEAFARLTDLHLKHSVNFVTK